MKLNNTKDQSQVKKPFKGKRNSRNRKGNTK